MKKIMAMVVAVVFSVMAIGPAKAFAAVEVEKEELSSDYKIEMLMDTYVQAMTFKSDYSIVSQDVSCLVQDGEATIYVWHIDAYNHELESVESQDIYMHPYQIDGIVEGLEAFIEAQ